ncbi:tyrosine-type recombinase/integrase [Halobacillus naozhouensis]|uniref:Tyrosine-type recombinase/integrase n=1 Tax=Halobacillus naozhouensis TaxID=554880 RepID=A0ABY8J0U1_9BACI|nr:tyrosine-type recombinase/integrase [Halobacillus naozhouensis]WFT74511.1 tyrosine-type recombinase/integrase [Halobacillus naozhouensis]
MNFPAYTTTELEDWVSNWYKERKFLCPVDLNIKKIAMEYEIFIYYKPLKTVYTRFGRYKEIVINSSLDYVDQREEFFTNFVTPLGMLANNDARNLRELQERDAKHYTFLLVVEAGYDGKGKRKKRTKTIRPFWPQTATSRWIKIKKKYNIKNIRLHDLRHTMVTLLMEEGESLKAIQERAGHCSSRITSYIYGHLTKKAKRSTAEKFEKYDPSNSVNRYEISLKF